MADQSWWNLSVEQVKEQLASDLALGLSLEEAHRRQRQEGFNLIAQAQTIYPLKIFWRQFSSALIWLLFIAALVAGLIGEWIDASAIFAIVIINGFLGFFQEYKAEKSIAALKQLLTPTSRVIREGKEKLVPSKELVPGDLLILESGDRIAADGRVVYAAHFSASEAALTGESFPVYKECDPLAQADLPLGERKNMVFMGTIATTGKAHVLVTETGLKSELGKIATLLKIQKKEETPLQLRLEKLGHTVLWGCLALFVIVFLVGLARANKAVDMLLVSLSLVVAAIPESLPAVVTLTLSFGVKKMAEYKALIRRLSSVETLGCTTVICTDKTGTLTQNEMVVKELYVGDDLFDVSGEGYRPEGTFELNHKEIDPKNYPSLHLMLKLSLLCNNAQLTKENESWNVSGDPTEGALIALGGKAGLSKESLCLEYPLIDELPFDSDRKRMSILRESSEGPLLCVKGAPDILLSLSSQIGKKDRIVPLEKEEKDRLFEINRQLAARGLRVLAFAYKKIPGAEVATLSDESDLIFVGLAAMRDPPRPEVKEAIQSSHQAHIRTVMVTGDYKETALAIADELGMKEKNDLALSGNEIDEMDEKGLKKVIHRVALFSRITAEHKLRIVRAFKEEGEIVAMTGDGVNDAPAIKEADIGVAMGLSGTDVTKEASDMVILDDNYTSIVHAVKEGRKIYQNIATFISYLLSTNFAEVLVILMALVLNFKDPSNLPFIALLPIQLLWLNLITDGLPALAMAVDPLNKKSMFQPPQKPSAPLLTRRFLPQFFIIGLLVTIFTLIVCKISLEKGAVLAHTMTFTTLIILELCVAQLIRSEQEHSLFTNLWFLATLIGSFLLQLAIIYLPFLQPLFKTCALGIKDWIFIGFATILFVASTKFLFSLIRKVQK